MPVQYQVLIFVKLNVHSNWRRNLVYSVDISAVAHMVLVKSPFHYLIIKFKRLTPCAYCYSLCNKLFKFYDTVFPRIMFPGAASRLSFEI